MYAEDMSPPQPTQEDFSLWLNGQSPKTPNSPIYMAYMTPNPQGTHDLVSQCFVQNFESGAVLGPELFNNPENHMDAVAAILCYAAKMVKYSPSESLDNQLDAYNDFLGKVHSFPGFTPILSGDSPTETTLINIESMVDTIQKLYNETVKVENKLLVDSLNCMANSIANYSSKSVQTSVFTQVGIIQTDQEILVTSFYTQLEMETSGGGGSGLGKKNYKMGQEYCFGRLAYKTSRSDLVKFAQVLSDKIDEGSVELFFNRFASPQGEEVSCFEAHYVPREL